MEILFRTVFTIIIICAFPIKILVSYGILDEYIKNTEWFVSPINTAGEIILFVWYIILLLIFYWIIRMIVLEIYRFINKRRERK